MNLKWVSSVLTVLAAAFCANAKSFSWVMPEPAAVEVVDAAVAPYKEVRGESAALAWPWEPAGSPATPFRVVKFAVPDGCDTEGARVECEATWRVIAEDVALYPVQEPVFTSEENPPFTPPAEEFYGAAVWPKDSAEILNPYIASTVQVLPVRVNVVRYLPKEKRLEAAEKLKITVTFPETQPDGLRTEQSLDNASQTTAARKSFSVALPQSAGAGAAGASAGAGAQRATITRKGKVSRNLMQGVIEGLANGDEITIEDEAETGETGGTRSSASESMETDLQTDALERVPPEDSQSSSSNAQATVARRLMAGGITQPTVGALAERIDMVIISPPDFVDLWPAYVEYRKATHPHLNIIIKNTDEIYADYSGVDHAQKIHHYIEDLFNNNGLEYVLLGADCPDNSGRAMTTVKKINTNCQIPTRYATTANNHAADLYYGCMDRIENKQKTTKGEVWDLQNDGLFMRTKSGADSANNCDLVPDIAVFRMPLRPSVTDGSNGPGKPGTVRTITAAEQIIGLTNKLHKAERLDFGGAHKTIYSGAKIFNYNAKGSNHSYIRDEREFFDGGLNFFADDFPGASGDHQQLLRYVTANIHSKNTSARKGIGLSNVSYYSADYSWGPAGSMYGYYNNNADIVSDEAHGQYRGTANWMAKDAFTYQGIHKLHLSSVPCLSGYFDFSGEYGGGNDPSRPMCCSEASVMNNVGNALAAVACSREGWDAGYGTLSYRFEQLIHDTILYNDAGKALLKAWQQYANGLNDISGAGGMCLFIENGMGDPLVSITPQYERTWVGASGGVQEWSKTAANWKAANPNIYVWEGQRLDNEEAVPFDMSHTVNLNVSEATAFNITCDTSTPNLNINGADGGAITLQGSGRLRSLHATLITGCTNLVWNVAGGMGRTGFRFVDAPGVLTLEGEKTRYFGTYLGNVRKIDWRGGNITFDFGDCSSGGFNTIERDIVIDGGTGNRVRSYGNAKAVFAKDQKVFLENGASLRLETYNCAGTADYDATNILFYVRGGSTLAVGNNPLLQNENLARSVALENGGALKLETAKFAFGNAAKKGITVFARGVGNRIHGTGPAKINGTVTFDVGAGDALAIETGLGGGDAVFTGVGVTTISGASTTTGTLTVKSGATLVAKDKTGLGLGTVVVEDGATLDLRAAPLTGLKTLIVRGGGKIILPTPAESSAGFYQVLEENGKTLQFEEGALVFDAADTETAIEGTVTSKSAFIVADQILMWKGDDAGDGVWSTNATSFVRAGESSVFSNGNLVVFGELHGIDEATVTVEGTLAPAYLDFVAYGTKYNLVGDGTIDIDNIILARDVNIEANLKSPTTVNVRGGHVSIKNLMTDDLYIEPGAEFRLTGTNRTTTTAPREMRIEFLTNHNATLPYLQGISFYNTSGGKIGYPNPITVKDYTGATATRSGGGSGAIVIGGGVGGLKSIVDGIYEGNAGVGDVPPFFGEQYQINGGSSMYPKSNTSWAPSSVKSAWIEMTFGTTLGTSFGYKFHSSHDANHNPKTWKVYFRENSDDPWVLYNEASASVSTRLTTYPLQSVNFVVPHRTYVTVMSGATLVMDGVYENTVRAESGARFKVLKDRALTFGGGYGELAFGDGKVVLDISEMEGITSWTKIIKGANLKDADLSRFECTRSGAALKVDGEGDLCIVTENVKTPPFSRVLTEENESWNTWTSEQGAWRWTRADGAAAIDIDGAAAETVAFENDWNNTVIDSKGELTITVARGVSNVVFDASMCEVRVTKIIVNQEDPDAKPALRIVADGSNVFAVEELDFTAFNGELTFDVPITRVARTSARVGGGVYYFPREVTGSLAVEGESGVAHVNYFTEGLAANNGKVALDQGAESPVALLDVDAWQGKLAIAKSVSAVKCDGTNGVYHLKNAQRLEILEGADVKVAGHLWTAYSPDNDAILQTGGTIDCTGSTKPYLLGVTRMTTRHRMSGGAVLNVANAAGDIGDRNEDNGYGELELREGARANFAAICMSKGWIDIHPGASLYFGGSNTTAKGSSLFMDGTVTVAGTIGAWQNSPYFNIPFTIDFPDEKPLEGETAPETVEHEGLPTARIDANGRAITLAYAISGRGALMATNTVADAKGVVYLDTVNTYAGGTVVAGGVTLVPKFAGSIGTGGLRMALGATIDLGATVRGIDAQFAADAEGVIALTLSADEAAANVPLATVAEGVDEVPANLEFAIVIAGRIVEDAPVKVLGNMIVFDSEAFIAQQLYATITGAEECWSTLVWRDGFGNTVAEPDWDAVREISISNAVAGASLAVDAAAGRVFETVKFAGAPCTVKLLEPSFSAVNNAKCETALDLSEFSESAAAAGFYAVAISDIANVPRIVQKEGWYAALEEDGLTFSSAMKIDSAEERTIDNQGADIRVSLLDLPEAVYEAGSAPIKFTDPGRVTFAALRPGWWATATANGITFEATGDLPMPLAWWIGDMTGGRTKGAMTMNIGDSEVVEDGFALKVKTNGIKVDGMAPTNGITLAATVANIAATSADQSLMAFAGKGTNGSRMEDAVGVRIRSSATSPNLWTTWSADAWYSNGNPSGNTSVAFPTDLAPHTYAVGYDSSAADVAPQLRGTRFYFDGAEKWRNSGLVSTGMQVVDYIFGAQRTSGKTIPATAAVYSSMMMFDFEINDEFAERVWFANRPAVRFMRDALPGNVLALTDPSAKVVERVQAFAMKAPVTASTLEFADGAALVAGPGGFRNEDAAVTIDFTGTVEDTIGAEVRLIEGAVIATNNIVAGKIPFGCNLEVAADGVKLVRFEQESAFGPDLDYENPVTGATTSFDYAFLGSQDLTWAQTNFFTEAADNRWVAATVRPQQLGAKDNQYWLPAVLDGNIIAKYSPEREKTDGKYRISCDGIEGWNTKIGLFNDVYLTVSSFNKFQAGSDGAAWIMVDESSRLTVEGIGGGNTDGATKWYVAASNGVEFTMANFDKANAVFDYFFAGEGTFKFKQVSAGTHNIKAATFEIGEGDTKRLASKTLIEFTSASATFNASGAAVKITDDAGVAAINKNSADPDIADAVGTYRIVTTATGVVIKYVARKQSGSKVWNGSTGAANWNTNVANTNWKNGAEADFFEHGDYVEFNSAAAVKTVQLPTDAVTTILVGDMKVGANYTFNSGTANLVTILGKTLSIAQGATMTLGSNNHKLAIDFDDVQLSGKIDLRTNNGVPSINWQKLTFAADDAEFYIFDAGNTLAISNMEVNANGKITATWGLPVTIGKLSGAGNLSLNKSTSDNNLRFTIGVVSNFTGTLAANTPSKVAIEKLVYTEEITRKVKVFGLDAANHNVEVASVVDAAGAAVRCRLTIENGAEGWGVYIAKFGTVSFTDAQGETHYFESVAEAMADANYDPSYTITVEEMPEGDITVPPGTSLALPEGADLTKVKVVYNGGAEMVAAGYVSLALDAQGQVVMSATESARPVVDLDAAMPFEMTDESGVFTAVTVPGLFYWVEYSGDIAFPTSGADATQRTEAVQAEETSTEFTLPKPPAASRQFYRIKVDAKK